MLLSTCFPSTTTAAAHSSQDDSIPSIRMAFLPQLFQPHEAHPFPLQLRQEPADDLRRDWRGDVADEHGPLAPARQLHARAERAVHLPGIVPVVEEHVAR